MSNIKKIVGWTTLFVVLFCILGFRLYTLKAESTYDKEKVLEVITPKPTSTATSTTVATVTPVATKKPVKKVRIKKIDDTKYTIEVLNVRSSYNQKSKKLGVLNIGTKVNVVGKCSNGWYKIRFNGKTGYVCGDYISSKMPFIRINSTAYANPSGSLASDGSVIRENFTLAGKSEWRGKGVHLYRCNPNGTVGDYMGYYEFHDTGWGIDGDIPRGETIDIHIKGESNCKRYGRRDVYMKWA